MTISMNLLIVLSVSLISSLTRLCRSNGILQVIPLVSMLYRSFVFFFSFRATQAYCNPPDKAITKSNNLSAKAGATNVTTNKGYVWGFQRLGPSIFFCFLG